MLPPLLVLAYCQSKPKAAVAPTLVGVSVVSFGCKPVRLLSLCQVVTFCAAELKVRSARNPAKKKREKKRTKRDIVGASTAERFERGPVLRKPTLSHKPPPVNGKTDRPWEWSEPCGLWAKALANFILILLHGEG